MVELKGAALRLDGNGVAVMLTCAVTNEAVFFDARPKGCIDPAVLERLFAAWTCAKFIVMVVAELGALENSSPATQVNYDRDVRFDAALSKPFANIADSASVDLKLSKWLTHKEAV